MLVEAENLFGEEHVRRYRETGGAVGHIWREPYYDGYARKTDREIPVVVLERI